MTELDRPLAAPPDPRSSVPRLGFAKKVAIVVAGLALVAFVVSRIDFVRDMHRLDAGMLGGAKDGSYHAIVGDLSARAASQHGKLRNLESAGSTENVKRLSDAALGACDVAFALVQDGADFAIAKPKKLELLGRLPKSESVFFLGRDAEKRTSLASLAGARIGVGPEASGSSRLAHQIFALDDLAGLGVKLSHHPLVEQLAMAERGELDLVVLVIDEDAPLLVNVVRQGRLQIAGLSNLDVIARRIPRLRTGRIGAGQYDAVAVRPAEDKRVLRVDTLVVTNGCAGRSATIDLLTVLADRFPEFVRHNKDTPNATGLELTSSSKGFFEHGGPELADEFVPWLVDLMPPANWAYIIMGVSVLFNAMSAAHRFRLWRIDDARVKLEAELSKLFGVGATLGDIQRTKLAGKLLEPSSRIHIDDLIRRFEDLGGRSRRQSLSMLVPMGQEMGYRYQEGVIYQTLAVLRAFRSRWDAHTAGSGPRSSA
jgi:TRAP-type uncharacterized transport system substrate-binding protein